MSRKDRSFIDSTKVPESVSRTRPPRYSQIDNTPDGGFGEKQPPRRPPGDQHKTQRKSDNRDHKRKGDGPQPQPQKKGWCEPKTPMETVNIELETYDIGTGSWKKEKSILHHGVSVFGKGGMRDAYRAWNCKVDWDWESHPMVLKMPNSPDLQNEQLVRTQVIMQAKCVKYAYQFNAEKVVSKKISYVPCHLVKFLSGRWKDKFGCLEDYIEGNFVKHNTVNPDCDGVAMTKRNTPQAFSHYTFEKSNKQEIVVDVQGVGDVYTDPQLYSISTREKAPPYGPADWAISGVANFFRHHQCNPICAALGLTSDRVKTGSGPGNTMPVGDRQTGTRPRRH